MIKDIWNIYNNKEIIIFGAGYLGYNILEVLKNKLINVIAFCDNNYKNFKETYLGIPIISPDELKNKYVDNDNILVQIAVYKKIGGGTIFNQLKDLGFNNIIEFNEDLFFIEFEKYKRDYDFYENLPLDKYEEELSRWYEIVTKEKLDLSNPRTFNEKMQWLKLYDSTPLKTRLADKYLVRDWIKEQIGEEYLIPLLGVYNTFDEIDFDKLPNKFILKTNHGCGWHLIVQDKSKIDIEKAREDFTKWLNTNFAFCAGFEMHYLNIPPKIVAEEYLENKNNSLNDYKFMCFNGHIEYLFVISDRYSNYNKVCFDLNFKKSKLQHYSNINEDFSDIKKPINFEKMIELSKKISKDFPTVRVDFYEVNGKIYFGELTFTSMSGTEKFYPKEYNLIMGDLINLPQKLEIPKLREH